MRDGGDHVVEEDGGEEDGEEAEEEDDEDDGEDDEAVGGPLESAAAAQRRHAGADLHGGQDEGEVDEDAQQPGEIALEEDDVAVVSVQVAADEVRVAESEPVDGVDASQAQLAEVEAPVDLVERVDVDVGHEAGHEALPPSPFDAGGQQIVLVRDLQVQGRADQPDERQEQATGGFVPLPAPAEVSVPEVEVEDVFRQRLDEQPVGELEQVEVHPVRQDDVEAHHPLALQRPRVQRPSRHPQVSVYLVEARQIQVPLQELVDIVLDQEDLVVAGPRDGR